MKYQLSIEDSLRTHFCEMPCFSWRDDIKQSATYWTEGDRTSCYVKTWKLENERSLQDIYDGHKEKHIVILEKYKRPSEERLKELEAEGSAIAFPHDEHGVVHVKNADGTLSLECEEYICLEIVG